MKATKFMIVLLTAALAVSSSGCPRSTASELPTVESNTIVAVQEKETVPATQDPVPEKETERGGYLNKLKGLYDKAKATGMSSAGAAQDMIGGSYEQLMSSGGATLGQSADWANGAYKMLKDQGLTKAATVTEWLSNEVSKAGQWEYRVVTITKPNELEESLNDLGAERWEVFEVMPVDASYQIVCKRPVKTFLSHVPSGDVIKLLDFMKPDGK